MEREWFCMNLVSPGRDLPGHKVQALPDAFRSCSPFLIICTNILNLFFNPFRILNHGDIQYSEHCYGTVLPKLLGDIRSTHYHTELRTRGDT